MLAIPVSADLEEERHQYLVCVIALARPSHYNQVKTGIGCNIFANLCTTEVKTVWIV